MAFDEGHVNLEMDTPQGRAKDTAKYLVGWKKVGGAWKVAYDMFNGNAPAAPPPPPTPAKGKGK
jgi:ketosteroid isomerase-like protein